MQRLTIFMGGILLAIIAFLTLGGSGANRSTSAAPLGSPAAPAGDAPLLTPSPTCAPSWALTTTQDVHAAQGGELTSVDAASASDVWSVGYYIEQGTSRRKSTPRTIPGAPSHERTSPGGPGVSHTLIERWDGAAWSIVPSPDNGDDNNELAQVSAVSTTDVWAVGYYVSAIGVAQTLTEHWSGSAWQIVPGANTTGLQDNELNAVEALAPDNVWAAGIASDETGRLTTLIEHWNGTAWSIVASPNVGANDNSLLDLAAISANDIWAAGYYVNGAGSNQTPHTLTLHWDGSVWSVVPTSAIGTGYNYFRSISGATANDVWAVGEFYSLGGSYRMLIEHWDGSAWNVIPPPSVGQSIASLEGVDARATNDVWAVGSVSWYSSNGPTDLVLHWDGTQWSIIHGVPNDLPQRFLYAVVAIAPQDVWAVGTLGSSYIGTTLAEHYSTACVSCPLRFSDVAQGDPFFESIECLACQGIVSGYLVYPTPPPPPPPPVPTGPFLTPTPGSPGPTSTTMPTSNPFTTPTAFPTPWLVFRPNFNVTRGQLAKIVSNSAGYSEDPGQQMFEDIFPYSTFYTWVNRLARRGILTGYPCGGPFEPCGPDNLPYFRPNNNATRGQISKIISNAAGFSEPHTEQTFTDVPVDSTFYIFIARLYSRSIVGGYRCGGPGEPCGPGSMPYFRPNNNATRGQATKIDAKALLPNCYVP